MAACRPGRLRQIVGTTNVVPAIYGRTIFLFAAAALLFGAVLPAGADEPAPTPVPALLGQMKGLSYLVGSWNCTIRLEATDTAPARTVSGADAFSIAPGNVLAFTSKGKGYLARGFIGYTAANRTWWSSRIVNYGGSEASIGALHGSDAAFEGRGLDPEGTVTKVREAITKVAAARYHDSFYVYRDDAWQLEGHSDCVKH